MRTEDDVTEMAENPLNVKTLIFVTVGRPKPSNTRMHPIKKLESQWLYTGLGCVNFKSGPELASHAKRGRYDRYGRESIDP